MTKNIIICGGGVIGGSTAYHLAKAGAQVTIIEKDGIAAGASGGAAGLLSRPSVTNRTPLYELQKLGFAMHVELSKILPEEAGFDYDFAFSSRAHIATNLEEKQNLEHLIDEYHKSQREAEWLDSDILQKTTNWIDGEQVLGAAVLPGSASVDAYRYTLALYTATERMGGIVKSGEVTKLIYEDQKIQAVEVGSQRIEADTVLIAMGPWSKMLEGDISQPIPVQPLKGQILKLRPKNPVQMYGFNYDGNYCVAKNPEVIVAGTTEEDAGFDTGITRSARDQILEFALNFSASLENAELIEQTACLRPLSQDGLPLMGEVETIKGLYISTGHGRQGILLSPSSGLAMSELILNGKTNSIDLSAFNPNRFIS